MSVCEARENYTKTHINAVIIVVAVAPRFCKQNAMHTDFVKSSDNDDDDDESEKSNDVVLVEKCVVVNPKVIESQIEISCRVSIIY